MRDSAGHIWCFSQLSRLKFPAIINILFCTFRNLRHSLYCFYRISTCCSLSGQHDRTGSLIDRIGNIRGLRSRRSWILHHGIQHLCSCDHRFSHMHCLADQFFLDYRNFLQRNLYTHITSGDHNSICHSENILTIFYTLLIFQFGDNMNLLATMLLQNLADLHNILCSSGERCCNKIIILLYSKYNVSKILRTDKWHIQFYTWNIYSFMI